MPYATDCALASIASVADNMPVELIMTRSYFKCTQITSAELSSSRHIPAPAAAAASVVVTSLTSQLTPSFSRYHGGDGIAVPHWDLNVDVYATSVRTRMSFMATRRRGALQGRRTGPGRAAPRRAVSNCMVVFHCPTDSRISSEISPIALITFFLHFYRCIHFYHYYFYYIAVFVFSISSHLITTTFRPYFYVRQWRLWRH